MTPDATAPKSNKHKTKRTPKPKPVLGDGYPQRTRDKVAIVGFAPHRVLAPFDDPSFEIWGLNRLHGVMPGKRWDRWFEIHDLAAYDPEADKDHIAFLGSFPGMVIMRPQDVGRFNVPNGVPFPLGQVLADFQPYFNNSIAYELALAIGMGFKEIHLFGVDMAQDHVLQAEYAEQRPSCEFFLGIAVGRGVKVHLPAGSDLLVSSHLYGLEEIGGIRGKKESRFNELAQKKEDIRAQINSHQGQAQSLSAHLNQLDGAMQEIEYELRNLSPQHDHRVCVTGKIPPLEVEEAAKPGRLKEAWK